MFVCLQSKPTQWSFLTGNPDTWFSGSFFPRTSHRPGLLWLSQMHSHTKRRWHRCCRAPACFLLPVHTVVNGGSALSIPQSLQWSCHLLPAWLTHSAAWGTSPTVCGPGPVGGTKRSRKCASMHRTWKTSDAASCVQTWKDKQEAYDVGKESNSSNRNQTWGQDKQIVCYRLYKNKIESQICTYHPLYPQNKELNGSEELYSHHWQRQSGYLLFLRQLLYFLCDSGFCSLHWLKSDIGLGGRREASSRNASLVHRLTCGGDILPQHLCPFQWQTGSQMQAPWEMQLGERRRRGREGRQGVQLEREWSEKKEETLTIFWTTMTILRSFGDASFRMSF